MVTSRCCPAHCYFCSTHQMMGHYRLRSVQNVLEEVDHLVYTYGMREIYFLDDNLIYDKTRTLKLLDGLINRRYNLDWHDPNGIAIYSLDEELIDKMQESGCYKLLLAIESGDQEVLSTIMHKPVDLKEVKRLVKYAKSTGMVVESLFMVGSPGETKDQINRTINLARSLDLDYVTFPIATPFPGTNFYQECKQKGYLVKDLRYENLKFGIGNIITPEFTPEYLQEIRHKAWQDINFREKGLEVPN